MSFDNNSFYDDNSTKNWQPQPTPMEDRRRRHTGKWITVIVIVGMLALAVTGTVHLVRDVGVTLNRSDNGFLLTIGTQPAQQSSAPAEQTQTTKEEAVHAEAPAQTQQAAEDLPQLTIVQSPAGIPTVASDEGGALSLQEIYRRCIGSVVSIVTVTPSGKASGTGIIMSEDGYVITNHHVIESAQAVSVLTSDNQEYAASVVGSDETSDLAVLKVEAEGLQAAEFGDSSVLQVGDSVAAIGDPLGTALRGTMTDGIISAINRDLTVNDRTMSLIQTNAALNNGNSGGPLINCYGQVIGINTMKMSNFYSSSATVEGIGFAIPIDTAKPIIDELIEKGYVSGRPAIGIDGETLPATYRIYYRLPEGIYVTRVYANSDAAAKGISEGDIITAMDGAAVGSTEQVQDLLADTAGAPIVLSVRRGADALALTACARENNGVWQLGAWIRDSMAGIGTLTYYDPATGQYGALGHGITDVDTAQLMPLASGAIMETTVKAVKKGAKGDPGELKGDFSVQRDVGTVTVNSSGGIFGTVADPDFLSGGTPVPVAAAGQITTGPATILATVSGSDVREYRVELVRLYGADEPTRNLLLRITDPALLSATGGIVQGMSGSPILQNGRIVGAVTHVLLNDPTRGYGIFIENMLDMAG